MTIKKIFNFRSIRAFRSIFFLILSHFFIRSLEFTVRRKDVIKTETVLKSEITTTLIIGTFIVGLACIGVSYGVSVVSTPVPPVDVPFPVIDDISTPNQDSPEPKKPNPRFIFPHIPDTGWAYYTFWGFLAAGVTLTVLGLIFTIVHVTPDSAQPPTFEAITATFRDWFGPHIPTSFKLDGGERIQNAVAIFKSFVDSKISWGEACDVLIQSRTELSKEIVRLNTRIRLSKSISSSDHTVLPLLEASLASVKAQLDSIVFLQIYMEQVIPAYPTPETLLSKIPLPPKIK